MTAKSDEPLSIIRQLELMRDLQRLANERWQEELRIRAALDDGCATPSKRATRPAARSNRATRPPATAAQAEYEHVAPARPSSNTSTSATPPSSSTKACATTSNRTHAQ